ncbi:hypothetical protein ABGB18_48650 [Nonomuraea sp. B12E4]|uniref:CopG family ribbon-helix-helix protein n=1 Tax=Nonomuraea sp. B12E4 TaxID=3153564 RepID=UPI00325D7E83
MATDNYTLRLDGERRQRLQKIADDQDRDMSYIIRKAIDEYIHQYEQKSPGHHDHGDTPRTQTGARPNQGTKERKGD